MADIELRKDDLEQKLIMDEEKRKKKITEAGKQGGLIQKDTTVAPVIDRSVELKQGWRESLGQLLGTRPKKKVE